ncbi:MAG: PAS domain S-box protein [Desulfobulbaceae bacterium]|nr:PAS domain S-box protein [Desulfobulbaceae bacterium]
MSDPTTETHQIATHIEMSYKIALLKEQLDAKEKDGKALLESEKRYRRLFESAKDGILILNADTGQVVDVNPFLIQLLGYSYDEFCGKYIWEIGAFKDIAASKDAFQTLQDNEYIRYEDLPLETKGGQSKAVEFVSNVYLVDQSKVIQCNIRDISASKQAKAERMRLMAAIEQVGDGIVMTDTKGIIQFVNPAFKEMTGYHDNDITGQHPRILRSGRQDKHFYRTLWETISNGKTWTGRLVNKRRDGSFYTVATTISPVLNASERIVNYVAVQRDITENLRLADQLQQAHKMEAIGLLAGGVAHDFNNMLGVILGYAEVALLHAAPDPSLRANLEEIIKAARRSAEITRQLLTFAHKQTITPEVLDLNQVVSSMLKMIRRLIGEDIELAWQLRADPYQVRIDPVQVDQILVNLCINARDALTEHGKITIETKNAFFDKHYCIDHPEYITGEYVLLAVNDNGCGMDKKTIDQIFDPFFTSKGMANGTGLGLSIVYGIVKQNHGFIIVDSEPGRGTTFKIFLPQHKSPVIENQQGNAEEISLGCGETLLLVEDEPVILNMGKTMLESLGYRVLATDVPEEALKIADKHPNEIQLLVTDVIMPGMNGRDLAKRIQSLYPNTKVLFMSGYTADVIAQDGLLDKDIHYIQKPFSFQDLSVKVQRALKEK